MSNIDPTEAGSGCSAASCSSAFISLCSPAASKPVLDALPPLHPSMSVKRGCKVEHLIDKSIHRRISHAGVTSRLSALHKFLSLMVNFRHLYSKSSRNLVLLNGILMRSVEKVKKNGSCSGDTATNKDANKIK